MSGLNSKLKIENSKFPRPPARCWLRITDFGLRIPLPTGCWLRIAGRGFRRPPGVMKATCHEHGALAIRGDRLVRYPERRHGACVGDRWDDVGALPNRHPEHPHAADGGISWDDTGAPLHRHPERRPRRSPGAQSKDPVAPRSVYLVDLSCRDVGSRRLGILRLRLQPALLPALRLMTTVFG
jgi:hypothetical protein